MYVAIEFICDESGDYGGKEWPPSPSRFLQAIVAGTSGDAKYLPLLRYLENVVPTIYATDAFASYDYETYVPDNDNFLKHVNSAKKPIQHRLFHNPAPHVVYEYNVPADLQDIFREAVSRISALGRAMDLVVVSVSDTKPDGELNVYVPDRASVLGSVTLETPVSGFVDSVIRRYKEKSKLKITNRAYVKNPRRSLPYALFRLTEPASMFIASQATAWIRHAAMTSKAVPKAVAQAISGHERERLTIVPLPTLDYNDNRIHRVVVLGENSSLVQKAASSLAGLHLLSNDGDDRGYLTPDEFDAVYSQYLNASRRWISVTPVVLSGYDDHDERKRLKLLEKMFRHAGLPKPVAISEFAARGKFQINAKHGHDKYPRMMCAVEFAEEVSGVVAVGTGRHYGMGVFANLRQHSAA